MEAHLVQAIAEDEAIGILFGGRPAETWLFAASSLGEGENPPVPPTPYIVWNELPSSPAQVVSETSNAQWRAFLLYVYDDMGDWSRINQILGELRRITKELAPFVASDGSRCSASRWDGFSGNIVDEGYHLNTRFGTARFMVSQ